MGIIIALLTFVLVVDCMALIGLILIQLPKKEAGLGLAFGGGAADALFGPGSGNILTKATKYAAGIFFVLAIILGLMQSKYFNGSSDVLKALSNQPAGAIQPVPTPPVTPEMQTVTNTTTTTVVPGSNVPVVPTSTITSPPATGILTNPVPPK